MSVRNASVKASLRFQLRLFLLALAVVASAARAHASVALLMEDPFGHFGAFNPTGHAAVYLSRICAVSPTELRLCESGELGVVLSRYHKIHHEDWIAIPLVPYLYAVENAGQIPVSIDREQEVALREAYWRAHLTGLAPAKDDGTAPKGEWDQLIGSSLDRQIHGFQAETTLEQDERLIAYFNDRRNVGHFNLFFHNCADFSRAVLDLYFPKAIHRNFIADFGLTTPKQVAHSLVKYGQKHPELDMSAFVIAQVPGDLPRSRPTRGVAESLVKSKRYLLPLAVLAPELTGGVAITYLSQGRWKLPTNVPVYSIGDLARAEDGLDAGPAQPRTLLRPMTTSRDTAERRDAESVPAPPPPKSE